MSQFFKLTTYFNVFFKKITHKKQYARELNDKFFFLSKNALQNNRKLNGKIPMKKHNIFLITYIIEVFFDSSNTLVQITNSFGKLKFFCSAGSLTFKGKTKKARISVIKTVIQTLINKLIFLQNKPIMLRFKNVGFKKG